MRISAKVDYAVRAAIELAAVGGEPIKGEAIADAQDIPLKFLENILGELKHTGIVSSRRGAQGGYWLAKTADDVSLADIVRAVEGPLASVRGQGPETPRLTRGEAESAAEGLDRAARQPARGDGGHQPRRRGRRRAAGGGP